jgi:ABC-type multidrug transport system fused ATPase/permease subunit
LDAEAYDRAYSDRQLVQRIIGYFRPKIRLMSFISLMIVLNAVMDTLLPILIAQGINTLTESLITLQTTGWLVGAILISGALSWTFNFFRQWFTARAVGDVVLKLRQDAFASVVARDMSFYDEFASGKIVSRVTSDTQDFATVVTLTLNLLSQGLLVILIVGVLFTVNVRLTLLALIIAPMIWGVALAFRRIARRTTQQARRALAQVNANVQESISGIAVAKGFRQEATIYGEFIPINEQSYQVNLKQGLVFASLFPILITVAGLGTVIIVYFGGSFALTGQVSAGDWFLFLQGINLFWFPLTSVASFWSQFQLGLSASERVFALIDAEPQVVQIAAQPVPRLAGRIEFRAVDFQYTRQEQVLRNFDLTIAAGETVALVGHTGAGKSSLGKLVARFYEFQAGQLLIDGRDIRTFDLAGYRRQLGIVPQIPFLFAGSVADNIRYGRPEAGDEAVRQAAGQVGHGDWLESLPAGLAGEVGEGGRGLSMGQRQLVALARLLLQDPAIVILDEATASVDPLAEAQIQEGLDVILAKRTAIVIAHRLSTIKHADRIIVLRQGEIIETGNHDQLMAQAGHYAELYDTYFRHQSADYFPRIAVQSILPDGLLQ